MSFFLIISLVIICLITAITSTLIYVRSRLQQQVLSNFKIREKSGVECLEPININGVEQWIHVRGSNADNPILLFIHGGPGVCNIGWWDAIQKPWENYFTVVQWDQRQAGKSYKFSKDLDSSLSNQQYINDALEMVTYLRKRFKKEKIFIMGTSYGTYISMYLIKAHPAWFHAYVAVGQVANFLDAQRIDYELLLNFAIDGGYRTLESELRAMAPYPDPNNLTALSKHCYFLQEQEGALGKCLPMRTTEMMSIVSISKWISPHYSFWDNVKRYFARGVDVKHPFFKEFIHIDLPSDVGNDFSVPIFFFMVRMIFIFHFLTVMLGFKRYQHLTKSMSSLRILPMRPT